MTRDETVTWPYKDHKHDPLARASSLKQGTRASGTMTRVRII